MKIDSPRSLKLIHINKYTPEKLYYNLEKQLNIFTMNEFFFRNKASKYKDGIKSNFKSYNDNIQKVFNQKILRHNLLY